MEEGERYVYPYAWSQLRPGDYVRFLGDPDTTGAYQHGTVGTISSEALSIFQEEGGRLDLTADAARRRHLEVHA